MSAPKRQPLAPRGGNDRIYTPPYLATQIVQHFGPFGPLAHVLEPCEGNGAFTKALQGSALFVSTCEIDKGEDFFDWNTRVDWIVTNPPWSQFRAFLVHGMKVADNIVFLALLNAWFMRARVIDMRAANFGMVEALMLVTPPKPWPQTGFQLAAVHIRRGHNGPMKFSFTQE